MENYFAKNKIGLLLFAIFVLLFSGSIYFLDYNPAQADSALAHFFYYSAFCVAVITVIHGRYNIARQWKEGLSSTNSSKIWGVVIVMSVCGEIINYISKYIGGPKGSTVGLILAAAMVIGIFLFFKKK